MTTTEKRKPGRRTDIDWEAIERMYRIGVLSAKEIAQKHGIAYSTLRKRIESHGWVKDLSDTVRIATQSALLEDAKQRAEEIGIEIGTKSAFSHISGVQAQVSENVIAIKSHAEAAEKLKQLAFGMMHELTESALGQGLIAQEVARLSADHPSRAQFLANVTSLKARAETADKIGALVTKFVAVERQARGLDEPTAKTGAFEEALLAALNG